MILFVCSSVFQLYVAIIIKKVFLRDKVVDLILTDSSSVFECLCKNEELNSLFNSVKWVSVSKNLSKLNRLQRSKYGQCFYEIFPKKYAKKIWGVNLKKYNVCYFSSYTRPNILLQYAIKKSCKKNKVHVFEDGISTYLLQNMQKSSVPKLLKKFFKVREIESIVDDVYVFEPNLLCVNCYKKIIEIPKPTLVEGVLDLFNHVFKGVDYKINEKFIFLEESFNNDGYVTNDSDFIYRLWECCRKTDFILKHHPRNRLDRFKTKLPTVENAIFWEHYLLLNSLNNKVLVSVSSNTVFVPHIISDKQKPTVILLYKLFNGTSPILGSGNFENYVKKYCNHYSAYTKEKFYIPETMQEFEELIKVLKVKEN